MKQCFRRSDKGIGASGYREKAKLGLGQWLHVKELSHNVRSFFDAIAFRSTNKDQPLL
jgi:hypothetical protein